MSSSSAPPEISCVVSTETGGLGNRLKSWVSAMRLDENARVHWPVLDNMPARFDELFDNDCGVDVPPAGAVEHKSWRLAVLPVDEPHLPAGFTTVGARTHPARRALGKLAWRLAGKRTDRYRYMIFPKQHSKRQARADGRHIDLEYERLPGYFRSVYVPLFERIRFREPILRAVDDWAGPNIDASVIGVQVRTWRDDPRRYRKYHLPSRRRLDGLVGAAGPDARFFVVSDSDEAVRELASRHGAERVLSYPRTTPRRDSWRSVTGMQEDLIDMLVLARTQRMFASYLSTFSEAAWWLGGASARVDVF